MSGRAPTAPHPPDLPPQLAAIRAELDAAGGRAGAVVAGLSERDLAWRPAPASWSIAECLDHLVITTEVFTPALDEAIERARARSLTGEGPFRLGAWGRLLVWYVEPPPPIRLPAPAPLRPVPSGPAAGALSRFSASQELLRRRLPRLVGVDLARAVSVSPIARYIRMNVLAFLRVHTAHERRHLWQAERVRSALVARGADVRAATPP